MEIRAFWKNQQNKELRDLYPPAVTLKGDPTEKNEKSEPMEPLTKMHVGFVMET